MQSWAYQARSKQTSFGQAILYHSLVCVHAHNLGGSGGMPPPGNFANAHPLKHVFNEILYQNTVQSEGKKPFK